MSKVLTQRAVETAKPRTKRYGRPDGLIPGQQLLIYPSGEKSYAILPRINGKQVKITIGNATILTLAEAREKGRRILAAIANGEDPRATRQQAVKTASETVEVVAKAFGERYVKAHNKSWREIERLIDRELLSCWGKRPITSISQSDVIALLDGIVDKGNGVTANRTLSAGRRMFNWCRERGIVETSPFDLVRRPAPETSRDRTLDDFELALLWAATEKISRVSGSFIRTLILTGQRRQEVAGMRWSELDRDLVNWTLPAARVKNGVAHTVPIPPAVRSIILDLPRTGDHVFTTSGRVPVSGFSGIKAALDRAITQLNGGAPIPDWTLHDCRRSCASGLAALGVSLEVIEKLLNHTSGRFGGVTGTYQRYDFSDQKRLALEAWSAHLLSLDLGEPRVVALRA